MVTSFKGYLVTNVRNDTPVSHRGAFAALRETDLDAGDVLIRVMYSSVNYDDAASVLGPVPRVRRSPCVGGIDLVGIVEKSAAPRFKPGDQVLATGYELGTAHHGGYAEYALVPGGWVLPLPFGMSMKESMAIGTAGFAAALAITRMEENGLKPEAGSVVVTGASGGVGSLAVDMLSGRGYAVTAVTSKPEALERLLGEGAKAVMSRQELTAKTATSSRRGIWAGAIDCLGGESLTWLLHTSKPAGVVASVGMVEGSEFRSSVLPFAGRGVSLIGIDATYASFGMRDRVWGRLGSDLRPRFWPMYTKLIDFEELPLVFNDMMAGRACGRTVVRIAKEDGCHD